MWGTRPDQNHEFSKMLTYEPKSEAEARELLMQALVYINSKDKNDKDYYISLWAFLGFCDYLSDFQFMIVGVEQVKKISQQLLDENFCNNFSKRNQKWIYERLNSYRMGEFYKDIPSKEDLDNAA